ncbi:MAG TPA: septum formation initiator family protein, partial [Patescibacteria group bacterium]|nr:septum formation initiator family protein [Patescibacteria group bacterium]
MKQESSINWYYRIWRSKWFVAVLCIVFILLVVSVIQEGIRRVEMRHEVQQLESEVNRLTKRNSEMQDLILLLNSSTVQDKEARLKLGVQKPGESLIILPDRKNSQEIVLPDSDRIEYTVPTSFRSNPKKW